MENMLISTTLKESSNVVMEVEQVTIGEVDMVLFKSKYSLYFYIPRILIYLLFILLFSVKRTTSMKLEKAL